MNTPLRAVVSPLALAILALSASQASAVEGMWMPQQLPTIAKQLKATGLAIDPAKLSKLTEFPMGAVVSLGGCTASFVSPQGLVVTNHHCAYGSIQYNSQPQKDLIKSGFLAQSFEEELPAAPGSRVFVTEEVKDVTALVLDAKAQGLKGKARVDALDANSKRLVSECEQGGGYRCTVSSFYGGAVYQLIKQMEIKDVRLVHAPADMVGRFGGDTDNWMWPRHTGDYSFYRAYVGPDGKYIGVTIPRKENMVVDDDTGEVYDPEVRRLYAEKEDLLAAVNDQLAQLAELNDGVEVLDWNRTIADNGGNPAITYDTVHLSEKGVVLMADAYRQALDDAARSAPIVVGGVSLGAAVAVNWALANPDRTVAVLAALPAWTGSSDDAPAALAARYSAQQLREIGLDAAVAGMRAGSPAWLADELARSWTAQWPALPDAMEEAAGYAGPGTAALAGLRVPMGVVAADGDAVHPVEVAAHWAGTAPHARLRIVELDAMGADPTILGNACFEALQEAAG